MKKRVKPLLYACLSWILVPMQASAAVPELHFSNEAALNYNDIAGPGRANSSLTQGWRYSDQLNVNGSGKAGRFDYDFSAGGKATDDKRSDLKVFSLTNLQGRISDGMHTAMFGDVFETFSQYALAGALKGAAYRFSKADSRLPEIAAVFGYAYPRWDNFYGDHAVKTVERQAFGARVKQALGQDFRLGASAVRAADTHRRNSTDALENSGVYTGDWEYKPIPGLTLSGEHSWSKTLESSGEGVENTRFNGSAHRVEAVGDGGPSRVSLEFERVSHAYQTLLGAATPDRLKGKAQWRYQLHRRLTLRSGLLWFRDDVDNQKSAPTHNWRPELAATWKAPFGRTSASADGSYKFSRRYGPAAASADHVFNLNYKDRFGELESDSNLGYTYYDASRKTKDYTYNTALNARRSLGELVLKPQLSAGGWTSNDELSMSSERIYEYAAGCGFEAPRWSLTGDLRLGQNSLDRSGSDNSRKFFADMGIYYRPSLAPLRRTLLYARGGLNEFRYTAADRNFRERSLSMGVNVEF